MLETLHKKQNFAFAIVTSNLFAAGQDDEALHELLNGTIRVPLTTYFTVGTTPLPQSVVERIEKDEDVRSEFRRSQHRCPRQLLIGASIDM